MGDFFIPWQRFHGNGPTCIEKKSFYGISKKELKKEPTFINRMDLNHGPSS